MTLMTRIGDLITAVGTDYKTIRTFLTGSTTGTFTGLTTTAQDVKGAINELQAKPSGTGGAAIDDATASSTTTYSSSKIQQSLTDSAAQVKTDILGVGVPAALDTLDELAAALGDDANYAATTTAALSARVRTDTAAQGLTTTQKQNARTNIDAYGSTELGNPETDLVALYTAAKA